MQTGEPLFDRRRPVLERQAPGQDRVRQESGGSFLGGRASQSGSEDQIPKERQLFTNDAFTGRVKGDFRALTAGCREEFSEPGFVYGRSEAEDDVEFAAAVLDFINLRGNEQPAVPYDAVTRQFAAPPVHQITAQGAFVTP